MNRRHLSAGLVAVVAFLFLAVGSIVAVKVLQQEQCNTLKRARADNTQILNQITGLFPPQLPEVQHIQDLIAHREPVKC